MLQHDFGRGVTSFGKEQDVNGLPGTDRIEGIIAEAEAVAGRFTPIHREHAGCIASDLEKAAAGDAAVGHGSDNRRGI